MLTIKPTSALIVQYLGKKASSYDSMIKKWRPISLEVQHLSEYLGFIYKRSNRIWYILE